jgi:hypothetical protein
VRINPDGDLPDSDLTNNEALVDVTLPPAIDIAAACPIPADLFSDRSDRSRNCGWTVGLSTACEPGVVLHAGCTGVPAFGPGCQLGECLGDPMLRVCEGGTADDPAQCLRGLALQDGDNACSSFCPSSRFLCPPAGRYTAWTAPKQVAQAASTRCDLAVTTGALTDDCEPGVSNGGGWAQTCGWRLRSTDTLCEPGARYRVGCDPALGPDCIGDTLLRVCPGPAACPPSAAIAEVDAACAQTPFTCPPVGRITVMSSAPNGAEIARACQPEISAL